jgi:hypothetical protein
MLSSRGTAWSTAILVAAIAIVLATATGVARAAAPAQTEAWISAEADYLSGRPLTVVCAPSAEEWRRSLAAVGLAAGSAAQIYGFSLIQQGEMHLSPYVCEGLRLGAVASTRRQNELQVSWSVDVLIHESVHLGRYTTDEALTEACARRGLPVELHRLYGLAYHSAELTRLAGAATWFRRTQGPAYQGGTCSPAEAAAPQA